MKKIVLVLSLLLLLFGCSTKRDDFYIFEYGDKSVAVGYDEVCEDFANYKTTYNEKMRKDIITYAEFYVKDLTNNGYNSYSINNINLTDRVSTNCELLNGELFVQNGNTCVLSKNVDDELLILELHGNILSDDIDILDHIIFEIK